MSNLGNILQNSLFYSKKNFLEKIFSEKFRHLFLELFFADPAPRTTVLTFFRINSHTRFPKPQIKGHDRLTHSSLLCKLDMHLISQLET
jgi:hypothetical protein